MTPATVLVEMPSKRPTPWSSCTTKSPLRRSRKLDSSRPLGGRRPARRLVPPREDQGVGEQGQLQTRG